MKKGDKVWLINRRTGLPLRGHDNKASQGTLSIVSPTKITVHHEGGSITMVQGPKDPLIQLSLFAQPPATSVTFKGWNRDYQIVNPNSYRHVIDESRWQDEYKLKQRFGVLRSDMERVKGDSITHSVNRLRLHRLKVPGKYGDQVKMFEALGYRVSKGINTRGQTCMVVYKGD